MTDTLAARRNQRVKLFAVAVLFGLAGLLVMWAKLYIVVPGFNVSTDAREVFVLLGSAVTGPFGGLIVGSLSSLVDPMPGVEWFSILDHGLGGLLVGWLSVRFVSTRPRNASTLLSWSIIVFMYYFIFPFFTFLLLSYVSPESYLKLIPDNAPFFDSISRLMMGWSTEFLLTLIVTSVALISLPQRYRQLVRDELESAQGTQWAPTIDGRWFHPRNWPRGISLRLMLWFLLLSVLPLAVVSVFIQQNVAESFLLAESGKQRETARFLAREIALRGISAGLPEMRAQKRGETQFYFVVDQKGKYVVHLDSSKVNTSMADDFSETTIVSILKGPTGLASDRTGQRAIGYAPVAGTDLRVVSAQGKDAITHALNDLQNTINIKLGSILLIISLVWGVVIWIIVGRPMRRLTRAAQEVAGGNLQVTVDPGEMEADIAILAQTFNVMTTNLGVVHQDMEWEISHRKTTEAALRESEKQFRLLAENSTDLISRHDVQGRYLYASPACRTLLGYEPEEMMGRLAYEFIHPDDQAAVSDDHQRQLARETSQPIAFRMIRKSGSVVWFESTSRLVSDPSTDQPPEVHVSSRDVTQRMVAELALKESEERLRTIVSNVPVVLYSLNDEGVFTLSEGKGLEKLGLKPGQVVGLSVFQVYTDYPEIIRLNRAALAGESSNETQLVGSLAFDTWISPIKDATGKVTGVIGVAVDVTDRKRAEDAARESEHMHKNLIEQSSDPIYVVQDNRLVFVNRAWEETFGYSISEVMGESFEVLSIVAPESRAIVTERLNRYSSGVLMAPRYEMRAIRRDGVFIDLDVSVAKIEWRGRPAFQGIYRDITERKKSEEAIRQSQKTESLGILAGGIAHDFNNLLQAMLGQISLALARLPKNALAYGNISKAENVAQRAAELTRQLLAYSGRGKFDVRPLDLNALIRENLHFLELAIPKNITLKEELSSGLPLTNADAGQIQQIVMNLIINGSEAIGERQGHIRLRTSVQTITADRIGEWRQATGSLIPGEYVQLEVTDSGVGMAQETLRKIFDPFFTTKVTGRGLGLSAVIGIVKGHHGGLRVESEAGRGTTFQVVFPVSREKNSDAVSEAKDGQPARHDGCILVVDDEPDVREVTSDMLTDVGIKPLLAEDGERAIEIYKAKWSEIDLVLLDLSMPGIGGKETLKRLKAINESAKIILTSGYSESAVGSDLKSLGLTEFIQKPYSYDKLMEMILRHLDKK